MKNKEQLSNLDWFDRAREVYTPNVVPAPLLLERGQGTRVYDSEGREYIDAIGGIAVSVLGHAHPRLVEVLTDQISKLFHTSNLFLNGPAVELALTLKEVCFADRFFFCNSGAEANEGAIKLARRYQWTQGQKSKHHIISFNKGFHGRTYGALAATPQPKYHEGFAPMPEGFSSVDYGNVEELRAVVNEDTAAILIEPIQGEGGINISPTGFLAECRKLANEYQALLIFDEVQTGCGRTGNIFAYEHEGVEPDIISMAKGIAGGLPLGVVGATSVVAEAFQPGTHNSTYSGNPLSCRAGLAVLEIITAPGFLASVQKKGQWLQSELKRVGQDVFSDVRGRGLLVGAELRPDAPMNAADVVAQARQLGLLIHVAGSNVVRFAPPLIISDDDLAQAVAITSQAISALMKSPVRT